MPTIVLRLVALAWLLSLPLGGIAASQTFSGVLTPENADPPIPIVIEFEEIAGRLIGRVKTALPLKGEGPFLSAEKNFGDECKLKSYLGEGVTLGMSGTCTASQFEGIYHLYFPDKKQIVKGAFLLKAPKPDKAKKQLSESERWRLSSATNTVCLKSNSMCLSACPRSGDYNTAFLCANTCKRKLNECKSKRKKTLDAALPPPD